jgi:uncharacterized protein with HEPN domain
MRTRIWHGYFEISLEVVWDTVQIALPKRLGHLHGIHGDADDAGNEG